jgi:hypothetical protein
VKVTVGSFIRWVILPETTTADAAVQRVAR